MPQRGKIHGSKYATLHRISSITRIIQYSHLMQKAKVEMVLRNHNYARYENRQCHKAAVLANCHCSAFGSRGK